MSMNFHSIKEIIDSKITKKKLSTIHNKLTPCINAIILITKMCMIKRLKTVNIRLFDFLHVSTAPESLSKQINRNILRKVAP